MYPYQPAATPKARRADNATTVSSRPNRDAPSPHLTRQEVNSHLQVSPLEQTLHLGTPLDPTRPPTPTHLTQASARTAIGRGALRLNPNCSDTRRL